MRVIVCGGRDFDDWSAVRKEITALPHDAVVVQGGARGADDMARLEAEMNFRPCETYFADWGTHGPAAGPIRNQQMADAGADLCIAFPGGRGTADMVRRCERAGIPVKRVGW